jgi:signal transduction histidine kinase
MTADALITFATQAIFFAIFLVVCVRLARQPSRPAIDTAAFFGVLALIVADQWVTELIVTTPPWWLTAALAALLMALPYLLLRLVDDFAAVPRLLMRAAEAGLVLSVVILFVFRGKLPLLPTIALVLYFVLLEAYEAAQFIRAARRGGGVTGRRMLAAAAGSGLLGAVILIAGFQAVLPDLAYLWQPLSQLAGLLSGIAYFVAFAPPVWLRRAWQEPELRAFLGRAASLPRLPDTASIVIALEKGAATSVGAPAASIGLWDPLHEVLRFAVTSRPLSGESVALTPGVGIAGQAFAEQRAIFSADAAADDPAHAELYESSGARAILAAPITAGDQRLGVLAVYAPRAPIFADEDLMLVRLLADQAAVILESRALIDEAARVRAREEATRLKDDFLSAAAHDLKTPLTTLVAQAQLIERRARRNGSAGTDLEGIGRIVREAIRLRDLVLELLDASRAEQGRLVAQREPVDLVELARASCERHTARPCILHAQGPVIGEYDSVRISQLIDNLIENAIKYSPAPTPVTVRVRQEYGESLLSVSDQGIGIPAADLPHIFDRFYRATNVDDRRFSGMGLGLYICKSIVMQHGGRLWVESTPNRGSTFHAALPLHAPARGAKPVTAGAQS